MYTKARFIQIRHFLQNLGRKCEKNVEKKIETKQIDSKK